MDQNTKVTYLYRDSDNYKVLNRAVIRGRMAKTQVEEIMGCLFDGELFIPELVGLDAERFEEFDPERDTPFFEISRDGFEETSEKPTVNLSVEKLVEKFREAAAKGWPLDGLGFM